MIFNVIGFFGTGLGKLTMILSCCGALLGWRVWDVSHQRQVGAHREQVRVETVGNKIDVVVQKKRQKVESAKPKEIDEAIRKYCRDC